MFQILGRFHRLRTGGACLKNRDGGPQGQILSNSRLGLWLYLLCSDDSVGTILEIGTWKGLGSTKLIADALSNRASRAKAISLETNQAYHRIASENLPRTEGLILLWGRVVGLVDVEKEDLGEEESRWLEKDRKNLESAPLVEALIPDTVDLLLLDGGEFTSWAEFNLLAPRVTKFILLDDVQVRKNRKVHQSLANSGQWTLLAQGHDRNGWSVWTRRELQG